MGLLGPLFLLLRGAPAAITADNLEFMPYLSEEFDYTLTYSINGDALTITNVTESYSTFNEYTCCSKTGSSVRCTNPPDKKCKAGSTVDATATFPLLDKLHDSDSVEFYSVSEDDFKYWVASIKVDTVVSELNRTQICSSNGHPRCFVQTADTVHILGMPDANWENRYIILDCGYLVAPSSPDLVVYCTGFEYLSYFDTQPYRSKFKRIEKVNENNPDGKSATVYLGSWTTGTGGETFSDITPSEYDLNMGSFGVRTCCINRANSIECIAPITGTGDCDDGYTMVPNSKPTYSWNRLYSGVRNDQGSYLISANYDSGWDPTNQDLAVTSCDQPFKPVCTSKGFNVLARFIFGSAESWTIDDCLAAFNAYPYYSANYADDSNVRLCSVTSLPEKDVRALFSAFDNTLVQSWTNRAAYTFTGDGVGSSYCDFSTDELRWCTKTRCHKSNIEGSVYCSTPTRGEFFCPRGHNTVREVKNNDGASAFYSTCAPLLDRCEIAIASHRCCFQSPDVTNLLGCFPNDRCQDNEKCSVQSDRNYTLSKLDYTVEIHKFFWKYCYQSLEESETALVCNKKLMKNHQGIIENKLEDASIGAFYEFNFDIEKTECIQIVENGGFWICPSDSGNSEYRFKYVETSVSSTLVDDRKNDLLEKIEGMLPPPYTVIKSELLDHRWYDKLLNKIPEGESRKIVVSVDLNSDLVGTISRKRSIDISDSDCDASLSLNDPDLSDLPPDFDSIFTTNAKLCSCDESEDCYEMEASKKPDSLSDGAIAGIVIGSISGVALLAVLIKNFNLTLSGSSFASGENELLILK